MLNEEYKRVIATLKALSNHFPIIKKDLDIAIFCVDFRNKAENYCYCKEAEE